METKIILDDTEKHRYLLEKTWDTDKGIAAILMLYPCSSVPEEMDLTTMLVINNLRKMDYGSVRIVNIFSKLNLFLRADSEPNNPENNDIIVQAVNGADTVIIAYGKSGEGNHKISKRQQEVLMLLEPFKSKLVTIEDPYGTKGFHPLTPSIRKFWKLVPFDFPDIKSVEQDDRKQETQENTIEEDIKPKKKRISKKVS